MSLQTKPDTDIRNRETIRPMRQKIWLILGPSGVGKSAFGEWLAVEQNWLHLEIDRHPEDGIDLNSLRPEWDDFYLDGKVERFGEAVHKRLDLDAKANAVLTFPGNLILSPDQMVAATLVGIRTIYLYGSEARCIAAFLNREQQTGRNLDRHHWITNNCVSYKRMSEPAFRSYRTEVYTHSGTRRPHAEVFERLLQSEGKDS
jgi:adenylate kinase family enzyme